MFLFAMGNSDTSKAGSINKNVRHIISGIFDIPTFFLLSMVFQLFFNVTTVEIFSGEFLMNFYGRVQVILGVFMLFQLSMTIIKGIVDPDSINDKKTGVSNLIRRIATALIMLVLLVPIRYNNPSNEYERQLNNNGILFGTLYSLQYRIIKNNTLGKIVFGNESEENNFSGNNSASNLKKASNRFVGSIIRTFYRINLKDDDGDVTNHADWMCDDDSSGWPDGAFEAYTDEDAKPYEVISLVDDACKSPKRFVLAYTPLLPAIVAVILSILILSFTLDVAIRTIKLGVLKLVAPIPIISYMDPKGSKDSAFNSWVKQLTSTYLDLFIRLLIIYFVVYLAMEISQNGLVVRDAAAAKESNTIIWLFTKLVIYIGLFAFAKQAPKFLKDIFGIKDDGAGFGGLFKGLGVAAAGYGAIGSFNAAREASKFADVTNGKNEKSFLNRGKHLAAGVLGGLGGLGAGTFAAMGAKENAAKAAFDAQQKRNARAIQRGLAGSTFTGRVGATVERATLGEGATSFDASTRSIAQRKNIDKTAKDLFSYIEGKGKTDGAGYHVETAKFKGEANGVSFDKTFTGSLNDFKAAKQKAIVDQQTGRGDGTFEFSGTRFKTTDASLSKLEEELAYAAGDQWALEQERADAKDRDNGYVQKRDTYNESILGVVDYNGSGKYKEYHPDAVSGIIGHSASDLKKTSKVAAGEALREESAPEYKKQQANFGATDKNSK